MNEAYLRDPDVLLRELAADRQNGLKAESGQAASGTYVFRIRCRRKNASPLADPFSAAVQGFYGMFLLTAALVSDCLVNILMRRDSGDHHDQRAVRPDSGGAGGKGD
jgi:hypothetical protein